ncbi:hypothetical protein MNBD_GAMMA05-776 [hydrothermal vent metagenome]|uniref:Porin domain-containing protein n=1 Tax=hydrothermal vent metagenome TaxID=652676 RepID=A0A3B0XCE9_9ZZZZ
MKKQVNLLATAILTVLASSSAQAIQFDGFMTVGAAKIADIDDADKGNVYIGGLGDRGISDDLSFERDTRFGLQISSDITDDMSVVAQILGLGDDGNFNAIIEWAYIDYKITDTASIHAGKIKQPVYLVNDYVEVGYAYPWIRPPQEVYLVNNPLNTVNGIELLLQFPVGPGTLSFQPYLGSNRDDIPNAQGAFFEAENIYGMDVKYSGRGYTAHASNFRCDVKTFGSFAVPDTNNVLGQDLVVNLNGVGNCNVTAVGFNLDLANVIVYAEWTERTTDEELSRAFGDTEAYYLTLGYRFGKFMPHITFASIEGEASTVGIGSNGGAITAPAGNPPLQLGPPGSPTSLNFPVQIQTSVTAGLRYEVNDSAALKVEYQIIDVEQDTAELTAANQGFNYGLFNTDFSRLGPQDKVGIFSVALDVIF